MKSDVGRSLYRELRQGGVKETRAVRTFLGREKRWYKEGLKKKKPRSGASAGEFYARSKKE